MIRDALQGDLRLSIKNYKADGGLSSYIFEDVAQLQRNAGPRQVYQIKGPMGRGLGIGQTGRHVAFTAGTGVLVFIDMVAHLLIRLLASNGGPSVLGLCQDSFTVDLDKFSFELYTSFPTENEAIGLDMIEMLVGACKRFNMPKLFIHHSNISSKGTGKRLDEAGYFQKF